MIKPGCSLLSSMEVSKQAKWSWVLEVPIQLFASVTDLDGCVNILFFHAPEPFNSSIRIKKLHREHYLVMCI